MKRLFLILFLISVSVVAIAQILQFNANGKFKIVQFTDTHYIYQDERSEITLERIKEVMDTEKPDFVILTGDVIYGKPAEESYRTVLDLISLYKVPFGVVFGNHDDEQGLSKEQLMEIIESYPYNLTRCEQEVSGHANYILPVKSSDGLRNSAILYCLDSHSYSQIQGIGGYDFIHFDQIQWYRQESEKLCKENGGKPLQAYAFFHIALPEFHEAVMNENSVMVGTRMETVCSPQINSGMFAAMKEMGDVKAVFVGHDHDNDYAVYWKGILLAYGRYTGGNTVYNHLPNGARVIELNQDGETFDTWIRLANGQIINKVTYPNSFVKKNNPVWK